MNKKDGMQYAPKGKPNPVVEEGEFIFSVAHLKHGHIYGMTNGLLEAGASLKYVYDDDSDLVDAFIKAFPKAKKVDQLEMILEDPATALVASAAITSQRADLGIRVMKSGKDYFTDKAPFTTLDQVEAVKKAVAETGMKYMVYYSENIHVESAVYAKDLITRGAIGQVVQVLGLGPHRLNHLSRPEWFYQKDKYGGILCDIGSHQIQQFLDFTNSKDASVSRSQVANYSHPEYPELEDFGDAMLVSDNGATHYFRVDWFTPNGLNTWGDGRLMILGTKGYIELRKYIDIGRDDSKDHVYLVNDEGTFHFHVEGQVGYPFFGDFILDCINRTECAMSQEMAIKAGELAVMAEMKAIRLQ